MKTEEINNRDPFVVVKDNKYYFFSSNWAVNIQGVEFDKNHLVVVVYESDDLQNWSNPKVVFECDPNLSEQIEADLWAPEVHEYMGNYYMFMSFLRKNGKRGTYTAISKDLIGEYKLQSNYPVTPIENTCIDGTLYVEDGVPYVVYSRDWPGNFVKELDAFVGEIWARQLSNDLSEGVGEPFKLFSSTDCPLSLKYPCTERNGNVRYGSDGPFVIKLSNGDLAMLWSPILFVNGKYNYLVLMAKSKNNKLRGEWEFIDKAIFDKNGGHSMIFTDLKGEKKIALHINVVPETPRFFSVIEKDGKLNVIE